MLKFDQMDIRSPLYQRSRAKGKCLFLHFMVPLILSSLWISIDIEDMQVNLVLRKGRNLNLFEFTDYSPKAVKTLIYSHLLL